ncbi:MAG: DHH family phosphoesterase [Candidatus Omnitrophica bacterium]|nr:DHH family phosphoesterase [Candidatus Omnitrophota bacterium]
MDGLIRAKNCIMAAKDIVISGHINPDGDSIGSLLSLGLGLEKLGKRVYMISYDGVPKRYRKLPGASRIRRRLKKSTVDLAISVDCSNKEVLGPAYDAFIGAREILEIDHHDFRRPFGDVTFVDCDAAAVGEMVYELLKKLRVPITQEIADNLMTSIIVETNSFRLPSVRSYTFEVCTELIRAGVNFYELVEAIFWSRTKESTILSGICLARSKFRRSGRIAWSIIRKRDFSRVKGQDDDVDAVPDEMRAIKKVDIAVLFRENGNNVLRVSLRSKDNINVASVAERYGGGGHFDVAGCSIPNNRGAIQEFLRHTDDLLDKEKESAR